MTSHFSLLHAPAGIQDDDNNDFSGFYSQSSFRLLLLSACPVSRTWYPKRHHWAATSLFFLCFGVVFVLVVVAFVLRFVPRMQPLKLTPPVWTLLSHAHALVAAPPPRRPGGWVRVAVGDDVDASLCGVDQPLSLGGIKTHCSVTQLFWHLCY